jgi:hypothetical protein
MLKLVYCRGGDTDAPKVVKAAGWEYGTRHDYTPYMQPYMLDINWENYVWIDYLAKVGAYRPHLAMTPDYFRRTPKSLLYEQIQQVREAGATQVMVCPKFVGACADIPLDCIVAVSVPTPEYAGFLPPEDELIGRKLHLLGGYPDQHLYLMRYRYPQSEVVSIDQNSLARKAQKGMWWSARQAEWIQAPRRQYSTVVLAMQSARRITEYLNDPNSTFKYRKRIGRCMQAPMFELV